MDSILAYEAETGNPLYEWEAKAMYDDMLDDVYGDVHIGFSTFSPSEILRELDPTTYRVGFSDYIDSLIEDGNYTEDAPEEE